MQPSFLPSRRGPLVGYGLLALFLASCWWSLSMVTTEAHQGDVYRIIYLHVPSAFSAFSAALILCICSLQGLRRPLGQALLYGKATAEVGLLFTLITLATGSIWGKPTWGVWWTWDARLTTTLILSLLYGGYLVLWSALPEGSGRAKVTSVLGILICADVPIIYKSVTWWRTLHQPPSLLRGDGPSMGREILVHLSLSIAVTLALAAWLIWQRASNLRLRAAIEAASYRKLDR